MQKGGELSRFDFDNHNLDRVAFGVENGVHGAAGSAVIAGQQQRGVVHHIAVAAVHAVGGVAVLQHRHPVGGVDEGVIAPAELFGPAPGLIAEGNRRLENHVAVGLPQLLNRLGKIHVAADGHAAEKTAVAGFIDRLEPCVQLLLEPETAGVVFVHAPGQLHRPVPCKAAAF